MSFGRGSRRSRRLGFGLVAVAGAATAVLSGVLAPTTAGSATAFGPPVHLTTDAVCGGYEPGLIVDRFNNVVVTAHKDNHCLAAGTDPNGTVRSQSWLWTSSNGRTFGDMPGLTKLGVDRADFGDEGDLAKDDANHLYFVDTKVVDNSFTRWKTSGNGAAKITEQFTSPAMGTVQPVDDRPWITAHGNGVVQYLGNEGDKVTGGGGRYLSYMSYDGGTTFAHKGTVLPDSGWCRPAADHRPRTHFIYAVCTNDSGADSTTTNEGQAGYRNGTLWSYVSSDDGRTFKRYRVDGYNGNDNTGNDRNIQWPMVAVDGKGVVYALFINNDTTGHCVNCGLPNASGVTITGNHLLLYRSTDHGHSWQKREITPRKGFYHYSSMDVTPGGQVGVSYYSAKDAKSPWYVYAGVASSFTGAFSFTSLAPKQPVLAAGSNSSGLGDLFQCAFGPDRKLNVTWEANGASANPLKTDIYFARQR
ncbi:MAG: hypothetical protein JWN46_2439 [Acidimicrobiales bacterium]|nr:hypothetical protein [Acidimicrobiales bacterium]